MKYLDIGMDLDGIGYNFIDALRDYRARIQGVPYSTMPEPNSWTFYRDQWGMTDEEFVNTCRTAVEENILFWTGQMYTDTQWAWHHLIDSGHRIHVVTDREYLGNGLARPSTEYWLERNNLPYTTLTISKDKTVVPADIWLDDRPSNYDELHEAGLNPLLWTRAWNIGHWALRVSSWTDFIQAVERKANDE